MNDNDEHNKKIFENIVGVQKDKYGSPYEYEIYFSKLNNSYSCNGYEKIEVYTKETNSEYFL